MNIDGEYVPITTRGCRAVVLILGALVLGLGLLALIVNMRPLWWGVAP